jgi:hypothetical protein
MDTPHLACTLVGSNRRHPTISDCYSRQSPEAGRNGSLAVENRMTAFLRQLRQCKRGDPGSRKVPCPHPLSEGSHRVTQNSQATLLATEVIRTVDRIAF